MEIKFFALCAVTLIINTCNADYGVETITPDWAKLKDEREREAIVRAIGERWWSVVPFI